MPRIISETTHKARKDRRDNNSDLIDEWFEYHKQQMLPTEILSIIELKHNGWKIKKGQVYMRQTSIFEGDIGNFCTLPEIYNICMKYKLYDNY